MSFSFTNAVFQSINPSGGSGGGNVKDTDFFNGLSWYSDDNKAGLGGTLSKDTTILMPSKDLIFTNGGDFNLKFLNNTSTPSIEMNGLSGQKIKFGYYVIEVISRTNGGFRVSHSSGGTSANLIVKNAEVSAAASTTSNFSLTSNAFITNSRKNFFRISSTDESTDPGKNFIKANSYEGTAFADETNSRLTLSSPFGIYDNANQKYHKTSLTDAGFKYSVFNVIDTGVWNEITELNENGIKMTDNVGLLGVNEWLLGDIINVSGSKTPSNNLVRVRINGTVYNLMTFETE